MTGLLIFSMLLLGGGIGLSVNYFIIKHDNHKEFGYLNPKRYEKE